MRISHVYAAIAFAALLLAPVAAKAALTTSNLIYNYDSNGQTSSTWTSSSPASGKTDSTSRAFTFSNSTSPTAVSGSATNITSAYDTSSTGATGDAFQFGTTATFETWIKPTSLSNGKQVILETGGNAKGLGMTLDDDVVQVLLKNDQSNNSGVLNNPTPIPSYQLTSSDLDDFIQIVVSVDGSTQQVRLYVNPIGTTSPQTAVNTSTYGSDSTWGDWDGGNDLGLGMSEQVGGSSHNSASAYYGDNYGNFAGQIGLVRVYDVALTGQQVADNFAAVVPEPATGMLALLSLGALVMLPRRRKEVTSC